jgi:hypothetical protein
MGIPTRESGSTRVGITRSRLEPGDFSGAKRSQASPKGNRAECISCDGRLCEDRLQLPPQDFERFSPALTGLPSPEHPVERDSDSLLEPVTGRCV